MSLPFRAAAALLPALAMLALAGCNKQEPTNNKAAAGAALLPRSVSDDMPPYDTVRSQNDHAAPEADLPSRRDSARGAASQAAVDADADAAAAAAADVEDAVRTSAVKPAGE
ncbi:hypothetical protein WBP06_12710 [Novosphingobium sp. BL-8H]|uniref:hypothetical protein n=1 Tax=Novosphingobium sp. BL-8H TaxID=3127640 RepID=UPI003757A898